MMVSFEEVERTAAEVEVEVELHSSDAM